MYSEPFAQALAGARPAVPVPSMRSIINVPGTKLARHALR